MRRIQIVLLILILAIVNPVARATPADDGRRPLLFVPAFSSNKILVFDPRSDSLVTTIPMEAKGACCAYVSPDQRTVYVLAGASPNVTEIDVATLTVRRVIPIPGTIGDRGSPLPEDGKMFWANTIPDRTLSGIDTATHRVTKTFDQVLQFENSRDGKWIFVTNPSSADRNKTSFYVRSTDTGEIVAEVPLPHTGGILARVSPDGRTVYLLGNGDLPGGAFTTVTQSWIEVVDVSDPLSPRFVTSLPAGSYVASGDFTPDGKQLWAAGHADGSIVVVDVATNEVVRRIDTGRHVCGVGFYGDKAYVIATKTPGPPNYATHTAIACDNVIPGSLTAPDGGSPSRPALDTPSEMLIYDRTTYELRPQTPIQLPSVAFFITLVMAPEPAA